MTENESLTLTANAEGRLCVCRQIEDYMFRPPEFEAMNFLNYMVETYEWRGTRKEGVVDEENDVLIHARNECGRYTIHHPKSDTHVCIRRFENHIYLPNIVGPWLP